MPGIYIHIPFCKQKCYYCNFFSVASSKYRNVFLESLLNEISARKDYLTGKNINTVYFGGGTPSLLNHNEINKIISLIEKLFDLSPRAEITLEANPDDLTPGYLKKLKENTRINRLSIGVQSFFDDDLKYLHRLHNSKKARSAIETALVTGFKNITIDLIYGIPTLTPDKWEKNLSIFFSYNLPHLSSYALTVEPGTALKVFIDKKTTPAVSEDDTVNHFETLINETKKHNFIHYEISNFAKEGFYSKHNSIYWLGGHYLGVGPSAHSFNGVSRQWNVSNLKKYVTSAKVEKIIEEKEILSQNDLYNEYVMTSLRTVWGCNTEHIENVFGKKHRLYFQKKIETFISGGMIKKSGTVYSLTAKGKLFADRIASGLFI